MCGFIDDALDFGNDLISGVGEIMDDQLGFDPNGGGLVPYFDAAGMATLGIPVGSIGAQSANTFQTLESGDFDSDFWNRTAQNATRAGTSYAVGDLLGGGDGFSFDSFTPGFNPSASSGGGTGFLGIPQSGANPIITQGLSTAGSSGSSGLLSSLGNFGVSALTSGILGGGGGGRVRNPNLGTSALTSPSLGSNIGNATAALYQADQARNANQDYLNYLYDAMALQKGAKNQAASLIGGAYDDALQYPVNIRDEQGRLLSAYIGDVEGYNRAQKDFTENYIRSIADRAENVAGLQRENLADIGGQGFSNQKRFLTDATNKAIRRFDPYTTSGLQAQSLLTDLLTGTPSEMNEALIRSPSYNFRVNEGIKALQNSAAARGNLLSGATLKEIQEFGQDMASQEYDKYVNQLSNLAGRGFQSSGSQAELMAKLGGNIASADRIRVSNLLGSQGNYYDALSNARTNEIANLSQNYADFANRQRDLASTRYGQGSSLLGSYYGDLSNLGLGKATNLANILTGGAAEQTNLLGQLASNQYNIARDTTPEIQAASAGSNLLGQAATSLFNQPAVQSGINSLLGGVGDYVGGLFGGGSSQSTPSFSSFDFGIGSTSTPNYNNDVLSNYGYGFDFGSFGSFF